MDALEEFRDSIDKQKEEEYNDPFSQIIVVHPALRESLGISSDIYEGLFDDLYDGEVFDRWINHKNSWQLHCVGGPGAGKTTFAAITTMRVRRRYAETMCNATHIASIFIVDDPIENELVFFEDFLHSVYRQLIRSTLPVGHAASTTYKKYTSACKSGKRSSLRIELITQVLRQRITDIRKSGHAFLVVDNIDQCSSSLIELLQRELSILKRNGLSILITSRLPQHEHQQDVWCDFHEKGFFPLVFYEKCMSCEKCFICEECRGQDKPCLNCGPSTSWAEPEHFDVSLDAIYEGSIRDFIIWDLEREHGDLGLGSVNPRKPPLSSFGMAYRKAKPGTAGREWLQEMIGSCNGSIVQVKLALDRVHSSPSPESVDFTPDRIAANVLALFSEAVESITKQPSSQRDLALKSIAAVGKTGDRTFGVPLSRLTVLLRERPHVSATTRIPPRSVEDILDAAKGYLRLMAPSFDGGEYTIAAFNTLFYIFAFDDYNDELVMANSLLRTSKVPRSVTRMLPTQNKVGQEQSWEEILGDLKKFQSPKLLDMSARKSPPVRQGSSGLIKSQTFMIPMAPGRNPTPTGLGVSFDGTPNTRPSTHRE
ncbi:Nn.00g039700.m01.CDS01 [Neocucurbitaria sp. VM-36]